MVNSLKSFTGVVFDPEKDFLFQKRQPQKGDSFITYTTCFTPASSIFVELG